MVKLLPILLICVLCICVGGNHMVKTFSMLVLRSASSPPPTPCESQSLGKLAVGPAQDLKSNSWFLLPNSNSSAAERHPLPRAWAHLLGCVQ